MNDQCKPSIIHTQDKIIKTLVCAHISIPPATVFIGSPRFPPNMSRFVLAKKLNFAFIGPYNPFPKLNSFVKMVCCKR